MLRKKLQDAPTWVGALAAEMLLELLESYDLPRSIFSVPHTVTRVGRYAALQAAHGHPIPGGVVVPLQERAPLVELDEVDLLLDVVALGEPSRCRRNRQHLQPSVATIDATSQMGAAAHNLPSVPEYRLWHICVGMRRSLVIGLHAVADAEHSVFPNPFERVMVLVLLLQGLDLALVLLALPDVVHLSLPSVLNSLVHVDCRRSRATRQRSETPRESGHGDMTGSSATKDRRSHFIVGRKCHGASSCAIRCWGSCAVALGRIRTLEHGRRAQSPQ